MATVWPFFPVKSETADPYPALEKTKTKKALEGLAENNLLMCFVFFVCFLSQPQFVYLVLLFSTSIHLFYFYFYAVI